MSVFEVELVSFPHQSSDSVVDPELFVFIFGCFIWDKLTYLWLVLIQSLCFPIADLLGWGYQKFDVGYYQILKCGSLVLPS